jgi:4-methyl-5(b-hydroxyethyl)-thiazole monophosphate biosynthesis
MLIKFQEINMSKKVLVPVADGTEELEAVAIIDCLRRAGADLKVASVQNLQITTSRKIKITADCLLKDCVNETFDLIALPGGLPGAEHLRDCKDLIEMLKKQKDAGRLYAAICAVPAIVLEHHGLLAGKKATCYPSFADKLKDKFVAGQSVVVDGNCITSQGPGTALEFALKLVEVLFGAEKSKELAKAMVV